VRGPSGRHQVLIAAALVLAAVGAATAHFVWTDVGSQTDDGQTLLKRTGGSIPADSGKLANEPSSDDADVAVTSPRAQTDTATDIPSPTTSIGTTIEVTTATQPGSGGLSMTTQRSTTTAQKPTKTTTVQGPVTIGVRGRVVDLSSGEPISEATISVGDATGFSGADGVFTIETPVRVGDSVTADKAGYMGARRLVRSVGSDGWAEVEIGLLSVTSPDAPPPPPG
jgi:hypothetical protein